VGSKGKRRFKVPPAAGLIDRAGQVEKLQKQMAEAQQGLAEATVTAASGGGAVTIVMTGTQELRSITIKPEVVDPEDVEMLQDLIMAAFKEAQQKSQELATQMLGPLAGGADLGGLFYHVGDAAAGQQTHRGVQPPAGHRAQDRFPPDVLPAPLGAGGSACPL